MPYTLSEEEQLIEKTVREFAKSAIGLEQAALFDRHDQMPTEPLVAAAGLGLMGMTASAVAGGAGTSATDFALAVLEIAAVCPNTAALLAVHNGLALRALVEAGPTAPAGLVAKIAAGELCALLHSEEAYGSNLSVVATSAAPVADGFVLRGQKVWGLGAAGAKHFLVLASVPAGGPTLLHVAADTPGVRLGRNETLIGLRGSGIRTVYFDDVVVPANAVVGAVGQGLQLVAAARPYLKVAAAAALVGCVRGAADAANRFAESRIQFGAAIGTYQAVSDAVTTMDVQLSAARALVLEAASCLGTPAGEAASARAKLFAGEMAIAMTRQAIRIQGGTGFMREGGTERFARDARVLQYLGETGHMQRDVLKRAILNLPFPAYP